MKKILLALFAFVLLSGHTMFLKLDTYFLQPNTAATIQLFNGTFDKSENVIDRDRMLDASLMGNGNRISVNESQWTEKDSVTILNFQTGETGTWVAGVSTAPRSIEMDAEAFNTYLEHEGILDMIQWRSENAAMGNAAVEKYSKHVKTIFQVGDKKTDDWQKEMGYPIEFIPLENPYELNTGDSLKFKLLYNGKPLANQLVYADFKAPADGHNHDEEQVQEHSHDENADHSHEEKTVHRHSHDSETASDHTHESVTEKGQSHNENSEHSHDEKADHSHSHDENTEHGHSHDDKAEENHSHDSDDNAAADHTHTSGQQLRTDSAGIAIAALTSDGIWYLQTIHLVNTEEEGFTHESNWTTLTFEVTHGHGEDTHTHDDDHEHEDGIPSYVYWIGSFLLVGILFFWFNRKK